MVNYIFEIFLINIFFFWFEILGIRKLIKYFFMVDCNLFIVEKFIGDFFSRKWVFLCGRGVVGISVVNINWYISIKLIRL